MDTQTLITELQSTGLRLVEGPGGPVGRRGGAGPSDHVAVSIDGAVVMIPVHTDGAAASPFSARISRGGEGVVELGGEAVAELRLVPTPRFYALSTADGTPYPKIALLHGADVLASTVLQTCVRYGDPATACSFCAIGQSLAAGRTLARKAPEQLAEVAEAAARLDGVKQVTLTTGTPRTADRGAAHLAECARAIQARVALPVQAQCEPPDDFAWFARMRDAGVGSLGMHLEAVGEGVRSAVMPGKAEVSVAHYFAAFEAAVGVFGRGQVSTYLIAGLGDPADALVEVSERLIAIGVYPFIVPLVPIRGTRAAELPPPSGDFMRSIYERVGPMLERGGLVSSEVKAGCVRCGACSSLSSYERPSLGAAAREPGALHEPALQLPPGAEPDSAPRVPPLAPDHLLRRAKAVRSLG